MLTPWWFAETCGIKSTFAELCNSKTLEIKSLLATLDLEVDAPDFLFFF